MHGGSRIPMVVVLVVVGGLTGCGDDSDEAGNASATTATPEVSTSEAPEPTGPPEVDIADHTFDPPSLVVAAGGTVTWTNRDEFAHTTSADDGLWDSDVLEPGDEVSVTFDEAGTFAYHCGIHNFMVGEVVVS